MFVPCEGTTHTLETLSDIKKIPFVTCPKAHGHISILFYS